jgi:hypothetical protein
LAGVGMGFARGVIEARALGGPSRDGNKLFGLPAGAEDDGVSRPLAGDAGRAPDATEETDGDIGRASFEARAGDAALCDPMDSLDAACDAGPFGAGVLGTLLAGVGTRLSRSSSWPLSLRESVPT